MAVIETTRDDIRALKGVHLFHAPMSNCSQRVRLALCEKGQAYVSHEVDLQNHEQLTEEFRALNPNAVVPVMVIDGETHVESNDIIAFVDAHFDGPALQSVDPAAAAVAEDLLARSGHLQAALKLLTYEFMMKPIMRKSAATLQSQVAPLGVEERAGFAEAFASREGFGDAWIRSEVSEVMRAFDHLDTLLEAAPFLNGAEFGMGDISWLPNVRRAVAMRYPLKRHPNLADWYQRVCTRASVRNAIFAFEPKPATAFVTSYGLYRHLRGTGLASYVRQVEAASSNELCRS